jgi:MFS family permease
MHFVMWLFPVSFFAYQFILRLWPGLMMQPIMAQFSIGATDFGLLAAFYYYGYAAMQIPVAMLLDRFGARLIIFLFAGLCGLATLSFTYTSHFYIALISRLLVGVGSAAGFLSVSKVVSQWFPKAEYASMIGLSFTVGLMGAIYGGKPIGLLIEHYSPTTIAVTLAIVSLFLGTLTLLGLRAPQETPKIAEENHSRFTLSRFKAILSPALWALALANLLMVGALEGFADVWGVPYLMTAYDLTKSDAAGTISSVFFGMLIGGPLLALISKRLGVYPVIILSGIGMAGAFFILLWADLPYSPWLFSGLFFVVGILCCYQVIVFAAGSNLVPPASLGITIAFLNCINMFGGSFFHTFIGRLMDIFWTGVFSLDGLRHYDLSTYHAALSLIPICALIGAALVTWISRQHQ